MSKNGGTALGADALSIRFLGRLGLLLRVAAAGEQVCDARSLHTHAMSGLKNFIAVLDFVE